MSPLPRVGTLRVEEEPRIHARLSLFSLIYIPLSTSIQRSQRRRSFVGVSRGRSRASPGKHTRASTQIFQPLVSLSSLNLPYSRDVKAYITQSSSSRRRARYEPHSIHSLRFICAIRWSTAAATAAEIEGDQKKTQKEDEEEKQ